MSELRWAPWCRHHALVQRCLLHHHLVLIVLVHGIEHEGGARPITETAWRESSGCHGEHWNAKLLLHSLLCHQLLIAMCVA